MGIRSSWYQVIPKTQGDNLLRLNLGAADRTVPGFQSVDCYQYGNVDVVADLTKEWPWEHDSVDEIAAIDIFEHLPSTVHVMNEAWRILKNGALIRIVVPTTEGRGAFQDPTHCAFFNRNSFFYFTAGDSHRERFGDAYGIKARFKVKTVKQRWFQDQVHKLDITLSAVK
jgi:hypothetical protein